MVLGGRGSSMKFRFVTKYDLHQFGRNSTEAAGYNIEDDFLMYQDLSYSLFLPPILPILGALRVSVLRCRLWFCGMMLQVMCFCHCDTHRKFWCRWDAPLRRCLDQPNTLGSYVRLIRPMKRKLQQDFYETIRPLYPSDQSAVCIMVKAVAKGPSLLGTWVQWNGLMGVSCNVSLDTFIHWV